MKTVEKAIKLLLCFSLVEPRQSLVQLGEKLDLPKATVFRIVKTLEGQGFLKKNIDGTYSLGITLFHLGEIVHSTLDLRLVALPAMQDLVVKTGHTAFLSVVVKDQKTCIEKISSNRGLQPTINLGQLSPLYAGSSGKLLLAFLSEEEIDRILATPALTPFTPKTTTDPQKIKEQLGQVRERGYATGFEQKMVGGAGISVPIVDSWDEVKAALSLIGPTEDIRGNVEVLVPEVLRTGFKISRNLGAKKYWPIPPEGQIE